MGDPGEEYLTKSVESRLKSKLYRFQMQRGCSINEHMNSYTKFLTDLINVDVPIFGLDEEARLEASVRPGVQLEV